MKHKLISISLLFLFNSFILLGQNEVNRISNIKNQLEVLAVENSGLSEAFKSDIRVSTINLQNFLIALSELHKINISVAPELKNINITNNFKDVTVSDLLVFLCKEYNLTIDFSGNILAVKPFVEIPKDNTHIIRADYNPSNDKLSLDAKDNNLYDVFKKIMDESGKNLVFTPGLEKTKITSYIIEMPFKAALENLAISNNLVLNTTKDNFYVFESSIIQEGSAKSRNRYVNDNLKFEIKDLETQLLDVDFKEVDLGTVILELSEALELEIFTAVPLENLGLISFRSKDIYFDNLLTLLFESKAKTGAVTTSQINQNNQGNQNRQGDNSNATPSMTKAQFSFKKKDGRYFFGTTDLLSIRKVEIIQMQHRSVELLKDSPRNNNRNQFNQFNNSFDTFNGGIGNTGGFGGNIGGNFGGQGINNNVNRQPVNTNINNTFQQFDNQMEALISILPDEIIQDLDIKVDFEINSFYVNGPSEKVERFKEFIKLIDQPVPVILIEVMILDVNKSNILEAGISWGIGDEPATTKGNVYPNLDLTLGAETVNKVIGGFDGFGSFKVVPNFFAQIKAMESNGDLRIISTPKLSTLNGHRATLSVGRTSYYAVTQRNVIGSITPSVSEITNFFPIDAQLELDIKPLVSGDGQVTLNIQVIQSSFGSRISEEAPPDIDSRQFQSIIRLKDQDLAVLGGLEEQFNNDSGSGVPFLARIPVIKWLFSQRVREGRKSKLTILIKPTVIY